jgi:hypothetical protein
LKLVTAPIQRYAPVMPDHPPPPEAALQIHMDEEVANGHYVNMALVNQTETEFTLDFIHVQPHQPRAKVRTRVILNPKHAKGLLLALQTAVSTYEARFGPLVLPQDGRSMN